jgi:uncharacterized surface protein with fasciclin (FAS1) repeats
MKTTMTLALLSLAAATNAQQTASKNIVETAVAAGQFKTLAAALTEAGLVETLSNKGPFTVFAPTDAAFAKLPKGTVASLLKPENKDKLAAILTYHVVAGKVDATSAVKAGTAKTLEGSPVSVGIKAGQLLINESKVVANDIAASNGIIHIIDSVLLPPADTKSKKMSQRDILRTIVEDAITAGVPVFNKGESAACVEIYRLAAFCVLKFGRGQLSTTTQKTLDETLKALPESDNDYDKAWALRRALDKALRNLDQPAPEKAKAKANTVSLNRLTTKNLFTFASSSDRNWRSVNDDVMGGISQGGMKFNSEQKTASFTGALSLKNNGGFSTVRSKSQDLGLQGYDGLVLRVKGDGRQYRIQALASDSRWQMGNYRASFKTTKGEWQEVRIPSQDMNLNFRGRRISSKPVDSSKIRSIGFSIADKNESPFELIVDSIKGYREGSNSDIASYR